MSRLSAEFWAGRTVLVTGHMGFKGAWLTCLLHRLGAISVGYGRDGRHVLLSRMLDVPRHRSIAGDVNDTESLARLVADSGASVLVHLAAQPIVLTSYADPLGTFRDNVLGTASVLEAARGAGGLEAIVVVTSDKVYENRGWARGYQEADALGGHDPYSASKAAAEIVTRSMARSFFAASGAPGVATARAGNVIGGGDWADHRLLPDAARAFSCGQSLNVRHPAATRPWQHVLEPLFGYLQLAQLLAQQRSQNEIASINFGPVPEDAISVEDVLTIFARAWGDGAAWQTDPATAPALKEAAVLAVDATLARARLDWHPRWRVDEAVTRTAIWYRRFAEGADPRSLVSADIEDYLNAGPMPSG